MRSAAIGGSDLSPAMLALADDPRVTAAVVVTDGDIDYPRGADAVRGAVGSAPTRGGFPPPYGRVVTMQRESRR